MLQILRRFFTKYNRASVSTNKLKLVLMFVALFWYATSGYLFFELEKKPDLNWGDALWWTVVTMTTVGYGDFFPVTLGGRYFIAIPTMIFGIGFLGFLLSETATRLIDSRSRRIKGMSDFHGKDHVIIINFSREEEILTLVEELKYDSSTKHRDICLVDEKLLELPLSFVKEGIHFIKGNPTDEDILKRANLKDAAYCIILSKNKNDSHSDDQNLVTTLVVEKLNEAVFTVVEVLDPRKIHQVELAGADSVVCVSDLRSNLIIQELQDHGVVKLLEELTCNRIGHQIYLVPIIMKGEALYKDLVLSGLDKGFTVMGIYREEKHLVNCSSNEEIIVNDKAVIVANSRISSIAL